MDALGFLVVLMTWWFQEMIKLIAFKQEMVNIVIYLL